MDVQLIEDVLTSERVRDNHYRLDNPEVLFWTKSFRERANIDQIFEKMKTMNETPSKTTANVVGASWLSFSSWVPKLLILNALKVTSNLMRHYIIQIVFEELGSRKKEEIHSDLFAQTLREIGITNLDIWKVQDAFGLDLFNELYSKSENASSDAEVLGLNLGLEINAKENIETLFNSLAYSEDARSRVENSLFFKIHKIVETEHIRLTVSNFLRFCPTEGDKHDFMNGFDYSIAYWNEFWDRNCSLVSSGDF
jgi:hypothetical protein